jgi:2-succinyl-5-enolpyruvyl-6-hydroxy-3-cyclohexene-1-carboxylate synthase
VVVAGRPTLSRPVTRLLARTDLEVLRLRDDPSTPVVIGTPDLEWLRSWQDADRAARSCGGPGARGRPTHGLVGGPAAGRVGAARRSAVAGRRAASATSTWPSRGPTPPLVLANRGASGIDGTVSTAVEPRSRTRRPGVRAGR